MVKKQNHFVVTAWTDVFLLAKLLINSLLAQGSALHLK